MAASGKIAVCDTFAAFMSRRDFDQLYVSVAYSGLNVKFIGSDMHNTEARPTQILKAYDKIAKIYGVGCADYLMENSYRLVENREVDSFVFKKKNIFTRFGK